MPELSVAGLRLSYWVEGDGEPVLLLASLGMVKEAWLMGLGPRLRDAGYQVIGLDTRGIGGSDAPPGPYAVEDLAADAAALIAHLGIQPCRVVGYSLGGFVAEHLAFAQPTLVRAVACLGSGGDVSAFGRLVLQNGLHLAQEEIELPRGVGVQQILAEILTSEQLQDDDIVTAWSSLFLSGPPWGNPGRYGQYAAAVSWVDDSERWRRWSATSTPALIVAFEHDVAFPPVRSGEAVEARPGVDLVVVPGAGHAGPFTHSDEVAAAVLSFLASR